MSVHRPSAGTAPPRDLCSRSVHVWIADLDDPAARARAGLTSVEERVRAERSLRAGAARVRVRARGLLRELLGLYAGVDPRAIEVPDRGAPRLDNLHFSVSHSRSLALFAFARGSAVGVDLEVGPREFDAARVAARAFGVREGARLRELSREDRLHEFLRMWTLHEARVKCSGTGMWSAAHAVGSPLAPHEPWLAELVPALNPAVPNAFAPIGAALAVADGQREVELLDWNAAAR